MARNKWEQTTFTKWSIEHKKKLHKQAASSLESAPAMQHEADNLRNENERLLEKIFEQSQTIEELRKERISLLKKNESLAKEREQIARSQTALLNVLSSGVWITDAKGKIIQKNAAADVIWGSTSTSVDGIGFSGYKAWRPDTGEILKPEDWPLARALSEGKPVVGDIVNIERFDGRQGTIITSSTPIFSQDGNVDGAVVIAKDITKQRQLEHQLKSIFDLEPSGLAVIAGPDLVYRMVNPAYQAFLPDQDVDPVGKTWQEVWQSDDKCQTRALVQRVLETGDTISASQHKRRLPNGKNNYYSFNLAPLTWEGEPAVLVVLWETTTLVRAKQRAESAANKAAKSAAELEAIFNGISDAVIFYDSNGKPIRANKAATQRSGFDPVSKTRDELRLTLSIHNKDGKFLDFEMLPSSRALKGEVIREEKLVLTRPDGTELHIFVSAAPLRNEQGEITGAVLSWKDITEMERAIRAQEQLLADNQRQRELLARLISEAPAAIAFMTGPEHRYSLINERFELTTRELGNIIGLRFIDVFPEAAEILMPIMDRVFETNKTYSRIDMGIPLKRGEDVETRYFSFSLTPVENRQGEVEGILLLMFETTEAVVIRQRLEAERDKLRESEERFRQLSNAMPQLVFTATPDGDIDYINDRYTEFEGIERNENVIWDINHVFHPEDVTGTIEAWDEAIKSGEVYQYEHRIRMTDGKYRWHLSRAIPVNGAGGEIIKWYGTSTNIDTQKLVETNLEEYARRLKHSNEELENFAFIASHDLQEPLRKIKSFGERVVRKLGEEIDEETQDFLARMMDASKRMQDMIQALLNLSRINTRGNPFEEVDLNKIVAEVSSDLESRLRESRGQVIIGELPVIHADLVQIRQLFLNLIGNAIKYHRPGVPPVVKISHEVEECEINNKKKCVTISVEDNGIGFAEEYGERIFQPFQRLVGRSEYEGTGIGLTICEKIVERHGGRITVESRQGVGSKFVVILPESMVN